MTTNQQGRYSIYLKPIITIIDVILVVVFAQYVFLNTIFSGYYIAVIVLCWFIAAYFSNFYKVYRVTKPLRIFSLLLKQTALFTIIIFALVGYRTELNLKPKIIFTYISFVFLCISFIKMSIYYLLKKYRKHFNGNYRNVIIIGKNKQTSDLEKFFKTNLEYGYKFFKTFSFKEEVLLEAVFKYSLDNAVDEIYCSISSLRDKDINKIISFADNNLITLKFIPDTKSVIFRNFNYEYYDYIPVLSLREVPLDRHINKIIKRVFDIVFSSLIIVFVLSWLAPIIAILIKLESKGPVFFKQYRNGFSHTKFKCYKFRSMTVNENANLKQATKNDMRVTKVGKFIRKTSIDELPQFFNVLIGDMSVAGPRPHMVSHTSMYAKKVDKFMVRQLVKPGITGLAQVSGFRGEIETDKDIINRVRFDIFYVENWSLLLDIKIVIKTIINAVKGEEKAY